MDDDFTAHLDAIAAKMTAALAVDAVLFQAQPGGQNTAATEAEMEHWERICEGHRAALSALW